MLRPVPGTEETFSYQHDKPTVALLTSQVESSCFSLELSMDLGLPVSLFLAGCLRLIYLQFLPSLISAIKYSITMGG